MTSAAQPSDGGRQSRWLPVAVVLIFALTLIGDLAVAVLFSDYRTIVERDGIKVSFIPAGAADPAREAMSMDWGDGARLCRNRGVAVEVVGGNLRVTAPGRVIVRFRAPDAGSELSLRYRFGARDSDAQCRLALARVASRYGVDTICRRALSGRRPEGTFKHYLADHVGWFELSFELNPAAAAAGFEISHPELVWD